MQISLENFMNGAVDEKMKSELEKVIENIMDPNTGTKARKLSIDFKIKPDEQKKTCNISFVVKSKLQPAEALGTSIVIGKTKEGYDAAEIGNQAPGQLGVDFENGGIRENGMIKNKQNKISVVGE